MAEYNPESGLFPALMKHWRGKRGLSQLDLALAADVSAKHISFLETGRSRPSAEMVVRLATTLGVPLRHTNAMLRAAGLEPIFEESPDALPPVVRDALAMLKTHHEPFPLVVVDRSYGIWDINRGALALFAALLDVPVSSGETDRAMLSNFNLARLSFDPNGAQPYIKNFDELGRILLWRIQREVLADPDDGEMRSLLDDLLAMPTIDPDWRRVDLSIAATPAVLVEIEKGDLSLRFLTMVTAFQAPQNVAVEELRVETW
ncbi:MAG: helix-turn-helix domain-containing protein, partial [Myxococcota bacterium]